MQSRGIYTLANDRVYDQLIALLNSIEANVDSDIPVLVIPFDQHIKKIVQEIDSRSNVNLFQNWYSIQRWEKFVQQIWAVHPISQSKWFNALPTKNIGLHRKFVTFDGPFDQFVFYDADSLAMKPLDDIFEKLNTYDFVFNDWEHQKPAGKTALNLTLVSQTGYYDENQVRTKLHCSSFFGSKREIFAEKELLVLQQRLIEQREIDWIPRWWDDAFLFNYLTLRSDRPQFNFTLSSDVQERTGNCADADPFININNVLYNEQGLKPIHRLHYMNYSSEDFARLSRGEDANIRYKEIFLHYRFLKQPTQRPKHLKSPNFSRQAVRYLRRIASKLS
jgi:hypothetical protein